ncbi:MAG: hypothetical protein K0U78_17385 [Actinomycetia bacterium]|nr:hypothetical protein [Actinomycetes bacterium]
MSLETRMLLFGSNDGLWCDDLLFGHVGKDQKHFRISFSDEDHSKLDDFWSKESLSNDKFRFVPFDENKDTSISMVSKKTDLEKIYASLGLETMVNDSLIDDRLSFIDTSTKNCWEKKPTPIVPNYFAERFTKRGSKQKDVWNRSRKNFTSWTSVRQQKERVDVTFESNNKTWSNSITTIETRTVSVHEFSESDGRHIQQKQEINQLPERKENRETFQNQQRKEKVIETIPKNETELVPLDFTDVSVKQSMLEDKYRRGSKDVNVKNESRRNFTSWTSIRKEKKWVDVTFESFRNSFRTNNETWSNSITGLEIRTLSVHEFSEFNGQHVQQKQEINQLPERKENRETCQNQQRKEKEIETTPSNETELVPLDFTDVFAIQLMFEEKYNRGSKDVNVKNELTRKFTLWTSARKENKRGDMKFEDFEEKFWYNFKTWYYSIATLENRITSVEEFLEFDGLGPYEKHFEEMDVTDKINDDRRRQQKETKTKNETELVQLMFEEKYGRGSKDVNVKNELRRKFASTSARKENKYVDMKFDDFEEKFWSNFKTWYYSIATLENRITSVEEFLKFDGLGPYEKHFEKMDMMDDDERNKKKETNERKTEMEPNVDMKTSSKKTETNIDKKIDTIVTRNQSRPEENAVKKTSSIKKTEIRKLWEDSRSNKTLETFERNVRHLWKNSNFKTMQFNTFTFVINQHYNGQIVKLTRKQFARTSHTIFLLCIRFKHICRQVVANFILTHERT